MGSDPIPLDPGTRSGGLSGCRFEHPDEHSNGPNDELAIKNEFSGHQYGPEWPERVHDRDCLIHNIQAKQKEYSLRRDTGILNGSSLLM